MNKKTIATVAKLTKEILQNLAIDAEASVKEEDGALHVSIDTDDTGMLIGYHGRTLNALQTLLGQMVYKTLGEWVRIVVDVGDYRVRRRAQLEEMVEDFVSRITQGEDSITISNLTPYERRVVHVALAEHPEVMSESEGEGRERRLVVKRRTA